MNKSCRMAAAGSIELVGKQACDGNFKLWQTICHPGKGASLEDLCMGNPFPIQAVAFHKSLVQTCGGLDIELDALEDWDLWVRFARHSTITAVQQKTSIRREYGGSFSGNTMVAGRRRERNGTLQTNSWPEIGSTSNLRVKTMAKYEFYPEKCCFFGCKSEQFFRCNEWMAWQYRPFEAGGRRNG